MDLKEWLLKLGVENYYSLLNRQNLTLAKLRMIHSHDELKKLGINSFLVRKKILAGIEKLNHLNNTDNSQGWNQTEKRIIENYPYLLAYPFYEMLTEKEPFLKLQLMKDLFLNILKYLGILYLTEYLRSSRNSEEINILFRGKMLIPQFGNWNHLIQSIFTFLKQENHVFLIPELLESFSELELGRGKKTRRYKIEIVFTDDFGDKRTVFQQVSAISALINFRNRYIGHNITLKPEKSKKVFKIYYPILLDLLEKIGFCSDYNIKSYSDRTEINWTGIEPETKINKDVSKQRNVYLKSKQEETVLPELFIQMQEFNREKKLLLYDKIENNMIVYTSVKRDIIRIPLISIPKNELLDIGIDYDN